MSTDASTGVSEATVETVDYDSMLETLDLAIEEATYKIKNGRIRDEAKEKVRVKQWKALGYLINVRRQVASDRDLEELGEKVEQLQQQHDA